MATISLTDPVAGTTVTAGLHAGNNAALRTAINGGLDNTNIVGGAAIAQSKIAFDTWQAYTPTWAASGVAPVLNNGTLGGRFVQIGKTVLFNIRFVAGNTTTFGTGNYTFTLPVTSTTVLGTAPRGQVYGFDSSAAAYNMATVIFATTTTFNIQYPATWPTGVQAVYGQTAPWTWATSDEIIVNGFYEAA